MKSPPFPFCDFLVDPAMEGFLCLLNALAESLEEPGYSQVQRTTNSVFALLKILLLGYVIDIE